MHPEMGAQDVSNILQAAAKLSQAGDDSLAAALPTLVERVKELRSELSAQDVTNIVKAAATLPQAGEELLASVLPASSEMGAQDVSNILQAAAKLSQAGDDSLAAALPTFVERVKQVIGHLSPQDVANIIRAPLAGDDSLAAALPLLVERVKNSKRLRSRLKSELRLGDVDLNRAGPVQAEAYRTIMRQLGKRV
ncbi:unnamed protein product [Effrenium voratum]|nr:unnamed protein product [Effrenium voratum]